MSQPRQTQPPASRVRRGAPPRVPWLGLIIWGLIFGVFGAVVSQVWRWTQPMLEDPPLPPFLAEDPIAIPTPPPVTAAATPAPTPIPTTPERPASVPSQLNSGTRGRVIEPIGLAIRAEPTLEAAYLGGIAFDEFVEILSTSDDGRWQRVKRELNGQGGWVKAGNIVSAQ